MDNALKEMVEKSLGKGIGELEGFLPHRKAEEYKHTPITRTIEKSLDLDSVQKSEVPAQIDVAKLLESANTITYYNGVLVDHVIGDENITVDTIGNSTIDIEEWNDPFHKINSSVGQDGLFLKVNKGSVVTDPVYIRHIVDKSGGQVISFNSLHVHAEENSEINLIEHFIYTGEASSLDSTESHYFLDKNARIKTHTLQLEGSQQIHAGNTFVYQKRDSNFTNITITLKGKMVRNNIQAWQNDEHCETHLYGLYMLSGKDHVDNHTTIDHKMPNSFSNELYKGVLNESSTGVFNGKIYVRPNAQQTNAFQSNNNILLTETATLHTKPQLEIWADDVKCSHGCTSGQLDEEGMFYLQTRGLDKTQARAIMLKAFVSEVIEQIQLETIREEVENKVDQLLFN